MSDAHSDDLTPLEHQNNNHDYNNDDLEEMYDMLSETMFGVEEDEEEEVVVLGEEDESNVSKIDEVLAQTMGNMSMQEREETLRDIYGVAEIVKETPELVQERLGKLRLAIDKITSKPAYEEAYNLSSEYVEQLQVKALRCQCYDPDLAANHLVRHLEKKKELFGSKLLDKVIRLNDLDDEQIRLLESGIIQNFPSRDRAGRAIRCIVPTMLREFEFKNLARVIWYMSEISSNDEETQRNGIVWVVINLGPNPVIKSYDFLSQMTDLEPTILWRPTGFHCCYGSPILRPFISLAMLLARKHVRARFRPHYGSVQQLQLELYSFGIPDLKIKDDGTLPIEAHMEWVKNRRRIEESDADVIEVPHRFDVLFGRGRKISTHTGNLRVGHLVEMYRGKYEKASKYEKTQIAETIVQIVKESNGCFLKQEACGWTEVSDEVAREKVSHFFRKLRSLGTTTGETESTGTQEERIRRNSEMPSMDFGEAGNNKRKKAKDDAGNKGSP